MRRVLLIILGLSSLYVAGQNTRSHSKQDTLLHLVNQENLTEFDLDILNRYAFEMRSAQADSSSYLATRALEKAESIQYSKGIADANLTLGFHQMNQGNLDEAEQQTKHSLAIYTKLLFLGNTVRLKNLQAQALNNLAEISRFKGNYDIAMSLNKNALSIRLEHGDYKGIASSLNNLGLIFRQIGQYPKALQYYLASLNVSEKIQDKRGIYSANNNIGIIYDDQQNYTDALNYYLKAYNAIDQVDEVKSLAEICNNIGVSYSNMGDMESSMKYLNKALELAKSNNSQHLKASIYSNLGNNYWQQADYKLAILNFSKALETFEFIGDENGKAGSYLNLGSVYGESNQLAQSELYLKKALESIHSSNNRELKMQVFKSLSMLNEIKGNYEKTFKYYQQFVAYKDSLFNEENTRNLVRTQLQYDYDKKESLAKANQDKKDALAFKEMQRQKLWRNFYLVGFVVVCIFALVFFSQRNKIKLGKKLSDELLLNILPSEVAEELKQYGRAEAKQFDEVTVMFTDFKGFTQLSERLSPAELVAEIDICFQAFDRIVEKYKIEKIKTIGDSYMCAGGLPVSTKTHAEDVVRAALEIQAFMRNHRLSQEKSLKEVFEIRIGIHTGPVVAGIVGLKKFAYDIWGDTVNTASRMESSGDVTFINISQNTYILVKDKFVCTYRGKLQAKNKGEIDMYFVENEMRSV